MFDPQLPFSTDEMDDLVSVITDTDTEEDLSRGLFDWSSRNVTDLAAASLCLTVLCLMVADWIKDCFDVDTSKPFSPGELDGAGWAHAQVMRTVVAALNSDEQMVDALVRGSLTPTSSGDGPSVETRFLMMLSAVSNVVRIVDRQIAAGEDEG